MTLNQVTKRIKTIALAHGQIKSWGSGLLTDFLTDKTTVFPAVYLQNQGGRISTSGHATTLNYTLLFLDLTHMSADAKENELDAQSDMLSVAQDIVAKMNSGEFQDWVVSADNSFKLLAEAENDIVAGVALDFSIRILFTQNICEIP